MQCLFILGMVAPHWVVTAMLASFVYSFLAEGQNFSRYLYAPLHLSHVLSLLQRVCVYCVCEYA